MTENIFVFLIIGGIQAATEFIPVSSSGHLAVFEGLVGTIETPAALFILVNGGTLAALILACWGPLKSLLSDVRRQPELFYQLLIATVPAAAAGFFLAAYWDNLATNLWLIGVMLVGVGILMVLVRPRPQPATTVSAINFKVAWATGWAQALALIPGTSRSGATILAGIRFGLSPSLAAQWSFIMAIPIIIGALLQTALSEAGRDLIVTAGPQLLAANLLAFVIGWWVLGWLLSVVGRHHLKPFGYYRILLGSGLLIWLIL